MNIIAPIIIAPEDVIYSNVSNDDTQIWMSVLKYPENSVVRHNGVVYVANYGFATPYNTGDPILYNEGHDPEFGDTIPSLHTNAGAEWWRRDDYAENKYKMFSASPRGKTVNNNRIIVTIAPTESYNALALFNLCADYLLVESGSYSNLRTLKYNAPLSLDFPNRTAAAFLDLPLSTTQITITLYNDPDAAVARAVHCGAIALGMKTALGVTLYETTLSMMDYSRKDREFDGSLTLIERGFSDKINYKFKFNTSETEQIKTILASRRAKLTAFMGQVIDVEDIYSQNEIETLAYGVFNDFTIPVEGTQVSIGNIEVESIVQDSPETAPAFPISVVFVTATEGSNTCLLSDDGQTKTVSIAMGPPATLTQATFFGRDIESGETVSWFMQRTDNGHADFDSVNNAFKTFELNTSCGQSLSVFEWPDPFNTITTYSESPQTILIHARINKADGTNEFIEPATLILAATGAGAAGVGWYDSDTHIYDLESVAGLVNTKGVAIGDFLWRAMVGVPSPCCTVSWNTVWTPAITGTSPPQIIPLGQYLVVASDTPCSDTCDGGYSGGSSTGGYIALYASSDGAIYAELGRGEFTLTYDEYITGGDKYIVVGDGNGGFVYAQLSDDGVGDIYWYLYDGTGSYIDTAAGSVPISLVMQCNNYGEDTGTLTVTGDGLETLILHVEENPCACDGGNTLVLFTSDYVPAYIFRVGEGNVSLTTMQLKAGYSAIGAADANGEFVKCCDLVCSSAGGFNYKISPLGFYYYVNSEDMVYPNFIGIWAKTLDDLVVGDVLTVYSPTNSAMQPLVITVTE